MARYVTERPALKYTFFGGKGGVGKTAMAGATALWLAKQGKRTLLASTNPVHSLSGLLGQNVAERHTPVTGVDRFWAYEIDTRDTIERSKREIREKIQWFLKFADISTKADDFVESATMNPAFEESAMFENMVELMLKNEYDAYVFDTAPTANARRLLGMSKVYSLWVDKMLKSREEARTLREMLSFTKKKEADPLLEYLLSFRDRMTNARSLLTDPEKTAFFFVTLPEALPIAVISRFIGWFHEFGIPDSWNQPMKRLITAIGSASGSVTKKNAVRVASVRSWRACPIRVRNPSRYSSSGSASFFFVKDSISRSVRASSRDFSILSTQSEYTLDMPRSRRAFAVGAVSKTYASYSFFSISSTMFSNMADSSNAGFIVADSTKSSAFVEMSANLRNHWIFSRISRLERSIVSRVSIS